jgi:hypothetical protein
MMRSESMCGEHEYGQVPVVNSSESIEGEMEEIPLDTDTTEVPTTFQFMSGRVIIIPSSATTTPASVGGVVAYAINFYQEGNLFCASNPDPVPAPRIVDQADEGPRGSKRCREEDEDDEYADYDDDDNGDEVCSYSTFAKRQKIEGERVESDAFSSFSELLSKPCEILTCHGSDRGILSLKGLQLNGPLDPFIVSFPEKTTTVEGEKNFDALSAAFRSHILGAYTDETSPFYAHSLNIRTIIAERKRLAKLRKESDEIEKKLCEIVSLLGNEKIPAAKSSKQIARTLTDLNNPCYLNIEFIFSKSEIPNAIFKSIRSSEKRRARAQKVAPPSNALIEALVLQKLEPCFTDRAKSLFETAVASIVAGGVASGGVSM